MSQKLDINRLKALRDELQTQRINRDAETRANVIVHMGTCGISAGARTVMQALMSALQERGITDVRVTSSGCAGLCSREPMATVQLQDGAPVRYVDLDADKIVRVLEEHVIGGKVVQEFALAMGNERVGS